MRTMVIAPHPDDEVLGCGGTLLKRKRSGHEIAWTIVTRMNASSFPQEKIELREQEIKDVSEAFNFDFTDQVSLEASSLDSLPLSLIIERLKEPINFFKPTDLFLPHYGDAHSDHRAVFNACISFTKWFRYPSIKNIFLYETISETDFCTISSGSFQPNYFVNISDFLEKKMEIMAIYHSEMGDFPFPRSREAIISLAKIRGAASGFRAAEAFQVFKLREE